VRTDGDGRDEVDGLSTAQIDSGGTWEGGRALGVGGVAVTRIAVGEVEGTAGVFPDSPLFPCLGRGVRTCFLASHFPKATRASPICESDPRIETWRMSADLAEAVILAPEMSVTCFKPRPACPMM
jgi:hypothetical protein